MNALSLERLPRDGYERATALSVAPEQLAYTGTVADALAGSDEARHPHGIWFDQSLVGFFIVDTRFDREFEFCDQGSLGIRTFLIDSRRQGQGLGKAAVIALTPYLARAYPGSAAVWLTVNCRNLAAYRCYQQGGFTDTGDLYLGGAAGPQHVMRQSLSR
ncbi:MAG: GNAT family N-acetyltransferase [Saccharospirillum sp.]|uniref:GNAT family N-acetyltransferase n=1 Tax=Saccharospirillum sp. TaxID=2033801 RepID=UPI003298001C